jgi:hypothetical protein
VRSWIAAQRQGDGVMRGAQAIGMAGSATGDPRQGLAKRAARAGVIDTSKAPDMHAEDDRASETRQITETAPVMRSYVASTTNTSLSGAVGEASISLDFQGDSLWPSRMSSLP